MTKSLPKKMTTVRNEGSLASFANNRGFHVLKTGKKKDGRREEKIFVQVQKKKEEENRIFKPALSLHFEIGAHSPWRQNTFLDQLTDQHRNFQLGILPAQLGHGLAGFWAERFASAFVFTGSTLECLEALRAVSVVPGFDGRGGVEFAAPLSFTGQGQGAGEGAVLFQGLRNPADRGVPGQCQWRRRWVTLHTRARLSAPSASFNQSGVWGGP